jgi:hypothetical protein
MRNKVFHDNSTLACLGCGHGAAPLRDHRRRENLNSRCIAAIKGWLNGGAIDRGAVVARPLRSAADEPDMAPTGVFAL